MEDQRHFNFLLFVLAYEKVDFLELAFRLRWQFKVNRRKGIDFAIGLLVCHTHPRVSFDDEQAHFLKLGVPGQEKNVAVEALDLGELFQHGVVHEADELPVFHLQDLLRLALLRDVGQHDFTVVRHKALVGNHGEVRDKVLWNRALNRWEALNRLACFVVDQLCQIVVEEVDVWSPVVELVARRHDL